MKLLFQSIKKFVTRSKTSESIFKKQCWGKGGGGGGGWSGGLQLDGNLYVHYPQWEVVTLAHFLPMHPFSTPCFQGLEKACIGNKWVSLDIYGSGGWGSCLASETFLLFEIARYVQYMFCLYIFKDIWYVVSFVCKIQNSLDIYIYI